MESLHIEFRAVIKFLTKESANAIEINRHIADVYVDRSLLYRNIPQWESGQRNLNVG